METLKSLPNIGVKLTEQLQSVGIDTRDALRAAGAKEAWLRILAQDPSACYMRLTALEGAVQGIPDKQLAQADKDDLKAFYRQAKGK